jgi:hypothetical protein
MSFSGANGGATPGAERRNTSRAFAGNQIGSTDHLIPTGHDQWKMRGPKIKPHVEAEDRAAVSG